jgi:hypothetical protein
MATAGQRRQRRVLRQPMVDPAPAHQRDAYYRKNWRRECQIVCIEGGMENNVYRTAPIRNNPQCLSAGWLPGRWLRRRQAAMATAGQRRQRRQRRVLRQPMVDPAPAHQRDAHQPINGGPPVNLLFNQGVRDNVSGHTTVTREPPGRVGTDNQTAPALCHNY